MSEDVRKPIGYVRYVYPWGVRKKAIYEVPPCSGRRPSPNVFLYANEPRAKKAHDIRRRRS